MNKLSSSPQRHTFQAQSSKKKLESNPDDVDAKQELEWYEKIRMDIHMREQDTQWQKNNMEYDLRSTSWILEKVRNDEIYAQNLYAAMCNNDFKKVNFEDTPENVVELLREDFTNWSCSWRYAGGIIADMREEGDYIDWYCSGIRGGVDLTDDTITEEQRERLKVINNFVSESVVTDEIRADLLKLGWKVIQEDE